MGEVFAKVHHVNIYFQSKAISQNFQILCEDKKKYRFSIERGFFFHALHLCQWFIAAIYLTLYCNYEYGLYQAKDLLLKYNYCNMTSYFYIETDYVIILSMICFVQASLAQKLWSNFKETYYIFLEILTITNPLVLSIRLNESFSNDSQNIFVKSFVNCDILCKHGIDVNWIWYDPEAQILEKSFPEDYAQSHAEEHSLEWIRYLVM